MPDLVDYVLDYLAGILYQVDDGKQDLAVGLAELLDDGGRLARSAGYDVVSFLHGGRLLSDSSLATGFYRTGPTAAYQPSTRLGTPSLFPVCSQSWRIGFLKFPVFRIACAVPY